MNVPKHHFMNRTHCVLTLITNNVRQIKMNEERLRLQINSDERFV